MSYNILKLFIEKGFLLDKQMLDFFSEIQDEELTREVLNRINSFSNEKVITQKIIYNHLDEFKPIFFELGPEKKKIIDKYFVNISVSVEVRKERDVEFKKEKKDDSSLKIISSPIIPVKKLEVKDFVQHFRSRYKFLKEVLQNRRELENLISIDKLKGSRESVSVIGIVNSKNITKNKNIILEIEDLTGRVKVLINQNKEELYKKAQEILLDDIIGLNCSGNKDFLYVNNFIFPDSFLPERKTLDEEIYAIFTPDIHVGSNEFLKENFERFIDWLNGENASEGQKELIRKIKYMFLTGDSIDGVGVYPGQFDAINIKDINLQYEKLAEYLKKIPKHITIFMCAGQHDGVRVAEPQPPVGEFFGKCLTEIDNLYLLSNPSLVELKRGEKAIKILMYHGASMHGIVNEIEDLRLNKGHDRPSQVVKRMLIKRHLAPSHSLTTYIPGNEDAMLIREIPDIITTADLHRAETDWYNNIQIITGSCWQSLTPFEEKVGNHPDPCKVPILNLKTREVKILDFS